MGSVWTLYYFVFYLLKSVLSNCINLFFRGAWQLWPSSSHWTQLKADCRVSWRYYQLWQRLPDNRNPKQSWMSLVYNFISLWSHYNCALMMLKGCFTQKWKFSRYLLTLMQTDGLVKFFSSENTAGVSRKRRCKNLSDNWGEWWLGFKSKRKT